MTYILSDEENKQIESSIARVLSTEVMCGESMKHHTPVQTEFIQLLPEMYSVLLTRKMIQHLTNNSRQSRDAKRAISDGSFNQFVRYLRDSYFGGYHETVEYSMIIYAMSAIDWDKVYLEISRTM